MSNMLTYVGIWSIRSVVVALLCLFPLSSAAVADDEHWSDLKSEIFGDQDLKPAQGKLSIFAPDKAANAAIVPVSIVLKEDIVQRAKQLYLIIDRNPVPIAAQIEFGEGYRNNIAIGERKITTRIRIHDFSQVRAVLEMTDGNFLMVSRFLAGAGGCSAPSSSNVALAEADLGRIKVKVKANDAFSNKWRESIVMIRHPNYSGMQMDPTTGDYTPAWYVERIDVTEKDRLIFRIHAGISLSENPHFRFTYASSVEQDELSVSAKDSEGKHFSGAFAQQGS